MESVKVALLVVVFAAMVAFWPAATAETFTVGGDSGWKVPDSDSEDFYSKWASKYTFSVGDVLDFKAEDGVPHTVAKVDKEAYDSCDKSKANSVSTAPATIELSKAGKAYYICTVGKHCSLGMKLTLDVSDDVGTPMTKGGATATTSHTTAALIGSLLLGLGLYQFFL